MCGSGICTWSQCKPLESSARDQKPKHEPAELLKPLLLRGTAAAARRRWLRAARGASRCPSRGGVLTNRLDALRTSQSRSNSTTEPLETSCENSAEERATKLGISGCSRVPFVGAPPLAQRSRLSAPFAAAEREQRTMPRSKRAKVGALFLARLAILQGAGACKHNLHHACAC